ncbi:Chaperone protein Skp [Candidatus Providencia siddallii]|uniref:Chaperone protein Skp n=1 Tax=Candidatus Providencia siddallii TaxID=1715285 RepID=A0A0M6W7H7_9GAMM|nr:Chaperone protein Skp [Candidatus Providencia siddallii]
MKRVLHIIITSIILLTSKYVYAEKIAIVNIGEIFQKMPDRESVTKDLENEFKSRSTELKNLEKDLQIHIDKLQRNSSSLKQTERTNLESELIVKRNQFADKAHKFEEDTRRRQSEERNKILLRIQDAIKIIADKKGYDIIIDTTSIAYAKDSLDITNQVQKQVK